MKRSLLFMLCFLVAVASFAQNKVVTGRVISSDEGTALPGVNIVEKGTQNGTISDGNGNFSLNVGDGATLVFSFVGYTTQEIPAQGRTTFDLALVPDVTT